MKKIIGILIILMFTFTLFGCTETNICGDGICSQGEEETCPTDCIGPVEAKVNVYVNGGYDITDLSVYWYHSKDVSYNAYQNMTSRLGENWFGSENKQLYINFNDSKSGSKPLGQNRELTFNFTEPGDYYFEARTSDYEYRAVSEKITISSTGSHDIVLKLVPSNPALRVRLYDESYNQLNGLGRIAITMIDEYCEYGECNTNEWLYDSREFYNDEELNELFFLYLPDSQYDFGESRNVYYRIDVESKGYAAQAQFIYPFQKYQEVHFRLNKIDSRETGQLKILIEPGIGTSFENLKELEGMQAELESYDSEYNIYKIKYAIVKDNQIIFDDLPYNNYSLRLNWNYNDYETGANDYTASTSVYEPNIYVDSELTYVKVKGLLGNAIKIQFLNAQGELIDLEKEELIIKRNCVENPVQNINYCQDNNSRLIVPNPTKFSNNFTSEDYIINNSEIYLQFTIEYNGKEKIVGYNPYKQGFHEYNWQFDN